MVAEIINFTGSTILDIPAKAVLQGAVDADLDSCIVIGDIGEDFYVASSHGDVAKTIYLLELAKHKLLSGDYNSYEED